MKVLDKQIVGLKSLVENKKIVNENLELNLDKFKKDFIELGNLKAIRLAEIQSVRAKIFAVDAYRLKTQSPAKVLEQLTGLRPEELYLMRLVLDETGLRVSGIAPHNEVIAILMKGINAASGFKKCRFLYTRKQTDREKKHTWIEFELKADNS